MIRLNIYLLNINLIEFLKNHNLNYLIFKFALKTAKKMNERTNGNRWSTCNIFHFPGIRISRALKFCIYIFFDRNDTTRFNNRKIQRKRIKRNTSVYEVSWIPPLKCCLLY